MDIRGLKFTHKSIRLMGGEGSGYHGHAGRPGSVGGSAPSSGPTGILRGLPLQTYESSKDHLSGIGTESVNALMRQAGISDEVTEKVRDLVAAHGWGGESQKRADAEIISEIESQTELGQGLMKMAEINQAVYDLWESNQERRLQGKLDETKQNWERGYVYGHDTLDSALDSVRWRMDSEKYLYRLGKKEGKVQSWTTSEEGFQYDIREGGRTGIGWTHRSTMDNLKKEGYMILAGSALLSGATGENEITLIRVPDWYKR